MTALAGAIGGGMMFVGAQRAKLLAEGSKARSDVDLNLRLISEKELALRVKLLEEHDNLVVVVSKMQFDIREQLDKIRALEADNRLYQRVDEDQRVAAVRLASEVKALQDAAVRQREKRDAEMAAMKADCAADIARLNGQVSALRARLEDCVNQGSRAGVE